MAGLQRSSVSFRRQGSSGLIWDDNFLTNKSSKRLPSNVDHVETNVNDTSKCSKNTVRRSRSSGARTVKEPVSPKVLVCGLCGAFGKR
nr:hypothetical protein [Tanacetum cinerariifolium]